MPQMVTTPCPNCDNLQKTRTSRYIVTCNLCDGLGATVKPQFRGTERGRVAQAALVNMYRMRLELREREEGQHIIRAEQARLDAL